MSGELIRTGIRAEVFRCSFNLFFVADSGGFACEKAAAVARVFCPVAWKRMLEIEDVVV